MTVRRFNWQKESLEKEIRPGVISMAIFDGENVTVGVPRLEPGHEPKPQSHPQEQIAVILAGTIDFYIGDEVVRLGPGDIVHVPSNVRHYGVVVGDEPVINLDVWYPKRIPGS